MRLYFDTNVVLDILLRASKFPESVIAYDVASLKRFDATLSASAFSDIAYLLHRAGLHRGEILNKLQDVCDLFQLMDVNETDCRQALTLPMKDIEDAMIAAAAARNGVDLILTRNQKDFKDSPVPAMSPHTFIQAFKPPNYRYELIDDFGC